MNSFENENGDALWNAVKATVKPLDKKGFVENTKPFISLKNKLSVSVKKPIHDVDLKPGTYENLVAGDTHFMDRKTAEKFTKGKMAVQAKLDLHGCFLDNAFEKLKNFIYEQSKKGSRCVLIVTGKGLDGKSVIRASFPSWMNHKDVRGLIVSFVSACPQDGGSGAFYVLLKRKR